MARAFTVLELLIALALVVAIAGLALPAVWGRTHEARLDAATRQLGAAIIAARVQAQRSGSPVTLLAAPTGEGEALVIEPIGARDAPDPEAGAERGAVFQPWTVLPAGIRLTGVRPGGEPTSTFDVAGATPVSEPVRIAVFMPDGSAVVSGPVYIIAGEMGERTIEITLNRWSGGATERELPRESEAVALFDESAEQPEPASSEGRP